MDRIVAVAFVLALVAPAIAALLGVTPESLEAREIADPPTIDGETILDPATYASVDRFLADRFPLRSAAVRAHAAIDYKLLGGSTNPGVVVGRDGWLFAADEPDEVCPLTVEAWLDSLDRAAQAAETAGIEFRALVAPDKQGIMVDRIAVGSHVGEACTDNARPALQAGIRARSAYAIGVWDDLIAARSEEPERPVYFATDTHWTPFGGVVAIQRLVDSLDPDLWDASALVIDGTLTQQTDLSRLMGLPIEEVMPRLLVRPDVPLSVTTIDTDIPLRNARAIPSYTVPANVPAVEGRTLVVYDSFFGIHEARIAPWLRESVWVRYDDLAAHPELVEDLPAFDRVILQRVERLVMLVDAAKLLEPVFARAQPGARSGRP